MRPTGHIALGIEGAHAAAADLIILWFAEKKANHEPVPTS
jgi:hypothetical protein